MPPAETNARTVALSTHSHLDVWSHAKANKEPHATSMAEPPPLFVRMSKAIVTNTPSSLKRAYVNAGASEGYFGGSATTTMVPVEEGDEEEEEGVSSADKNSTR